MSRSLAFREYFYFIDVHGQLFLHDTVPKNFTTCFKDKKFLDFFFKRLKKNDVGIYEKEYEYVSPCGKELNFVNVADKPIVFQQISSDGKTLCWGGTLSYPFQPSKLSVSPLGRLYHPSPLGTGLIRSSIAFQLIDKLSYDSNGKQTLEWDGKIYNLEP